MTRSPSSSRKRLLAAALNLFSDQGFNLTTTRQIADLAEVNEATLFRNFGSKHDLLLAVIDDSGMFSHLHESFSGSSMESDSLAGAITNYARDRLLRLEQHSELLRALVGEAGQYSVMQQRVLAQRLTQSTQELAAYLARVMERERVTAYVSSEALARLLNSLLYGCLVTELTSELHSGGTNRDTFIDSVVQLCLHGAIASSPPDIVTMSEQQGRVTALPDSMSKHDEKRIADLPADVVRSILQQAKKHGAQTYAIVYLLFGSGILPTEVLGLRRSHHISNARQHLVQINHGAVRQVPVNQWVMGKRYGSYANNPLSQWLKSRKDQDPSLFLTDQGQPLTQSALLELWHAATADMLAPDNSPPHIEQARQTWCVEMLMKGMSVDDLSLLSGWTTAQLQPYVRRAREKAALERALQLDQKSS
ncbi:MAG: TetR family transcriptional regulator [Cyanobacteria bacterium P01_E01_bin.6]